MYSFLEASTVLSCQRFERLMDSFPCASLVLVGWPLSLRRTGVKIQRPALEFALVLLPATGYAGASLSLSFGSSAVRSSSLLGGFEGMPQR